MKCRSKAIGASQARPTGGTGGLAREVGAGTDMGEILYRAAGAALMVVAGAARVGGGALGIYSCQC